MALFSFTDKTLLYFPGCFSLAFNRSKVENYRKILKKLSINAAIMEEIKCCGSIIKDSGYEKQFRKLARKNSSILSEKSIKKIILSDPKCFLSFSKSYKENLPDWNIESEFILETILKKLLENPKLIKNTFLEQITYYDSRSSHSINILLC